MNVQLDQGTARKIVNLPPALEHAVGVFTATHRLSAREADVFRCLLCNVTTAEGIGAQLGVSRNTIRNHFQNIFGKTKTTSKTELLAAFIHTWPQVAADASKASFAR